MSTKGQEPELGIIEWPQQGSGKFFVVTWTKGRGYFPLAGPFGYGYTRRQGAQDAYDWATLAL